MSVAIGLSDEPLLANKVAIIDERGIPTASMMGGPNGPLSGPFHG